MKLYIQSSFILKYINTSLLSLIKRSMSKHNKLIYDILPSMIINYLRVETAHCRGILKWKTLVLITCQYITSFSTSTHVISPYKQLISVF